MNRVNDPADPRRCQSTVASSQCDRVCEPGTEYCRLHGPSGAKALEVESRRQYLLTEARYRQRLAQLNEHDPLFALHHAISLLRVLIEKRFNLVRDETDLLMAYGDINMLQLTLERLVKSAHLIEQNLGTLLGKPTVLRLGRLVLQIVIDELQGVKNGPEVIDKIASRSIQAIYQARNCNEPVPMVAPARIMKDRTQGQKLFEISNIEDQLRLIQFYDDPAIKSLVDDISIQVMLIESRWNMIRGPIDLIAACGQLNQGLKTLEKLVKTAHEMEQDLGNLLNRESVVRLAQNLNEIIVEELEYADIPGYEIIVDRICRQASDALTVATVRALQ